ncbi:hypothetical protein C4K22_3312 [Pseudomonas chlororaphis subsp. aurantiaca]|nr:hypothetical protein C4K22_3312 [Pseudomonas chlororaphis subsp. aurantiaca]AZD42393.1 hypothetical protein C4K21_3319 [Pseudomonas chlororaphis subsp. aurantiaca]
MLFTSSDEHRPRHPGINSPLGGLLPWRSGWRSMPVYAALENGVTMKNPPRGNQVPQRRLPR